LTASQIASGIVTGNLIFEGQAVLFVTTLEDEAQTVMEGKRAHMTWKSLKS
jgi:hypothetical protein